MDVANIDDKNTYNSNGAEPIIDVTFWSPRVNSNLLNVGYTSGDHLVIRYRVEYEGNTDELVETLSHATKPRRSLLRPDRRPVYWWLSPEIAGLHVSCLKATRRYQRAGTHKGR